MSQEIKFNLIRHFGPSVLHAKIPKTVIEILNKYIDETIKDIRQEAFGTTKQPNQINGLASLQQALKSNIG